MQPISSTGRAKVSMLRSIANSARMPEDNRKAAREGLAEWERKAHEAGAESLDAWLAATPAPSNGLVAYYMRQGVSEADARAMAAAGSMP